MPQIVDSSAMQAAAVYIGLFLLGLIALVLPVILQRGRAKVGLGDGGDPELVRAMRIHGNYVENVPFGLAALIAMPLVGAPVWSIHAVGLCLIAGRIAHAYGLSQSSGASPGRIIGVGLTCTALVVAALTLIVSGFV